MCPERPTKIHQNPEDRKDPVTLVELYNTQKECPNAPKKPSFDGKREEPSTLWGLCGNQ